MSEKNKGLTIGLSGIIGAGKSTYCKSFNSMFNDKNSEQRILSYEALKKFHW